jgi:hypothetical protein
LFDLAFVALDGHTEEKKEAVGKGEEKKKLEKKADSVAASANTVRLSFSAAGSCTRGSIAGHTAKVDTELLSRLF